MAVPRTVALLVASNRSGAQPAAVSRLAAHPPAALRPDAAHPGRGWALALTSVAFFMAALDLLVVMTALPAIQRQLGASLATLEWTVNAYSLASAAGIISAAALGDRFGRRRVFALGLIIFTLASAACALAPSAALLVAARAVQGVGGAIIAPLSLTILTTAFPRERRGTIVGLWGGLGGLAIAGGPLVGGAVTQGLDWHWIFWVNVPIGLAAAVLSIRRLTESRGPATRLDLPAVALASGGAVGLIWGLVRANALGWGSAPVLASIILGLLLLAGFIAWERRAAEPMLPPRLFRSPAFAAASATAFLMNAALMAAAFLVSQYLQVVLGYAPLAAGLHFLPMTATPLLAAPLAGVLADRIGPRPLMVAGLLLQAGGLGWFALVAAPTAGYAPLVLPLILAGVGVSLPFATVPAAALSAVAPADMGKASGATSTLQRFGGVFGIAAASAVFAGSGQLGTAASFATGVRPALLLAAAFSLLGALTALAVGAARPAAATTIRPAQAVPAATGAPSVNRATLIAE